MSSIDEPLLRHGPLSVQASHKWQTSAPISRWLPYMLLLTECGCQPIAISVDDNEDHFPIKRACVVQVLPGSWRMQWSLFRSIYTDRRRVTVELSSRRHALINERRVRRVVQRCQRKTRVRLPVRPDTGGRGAERLFACCICFFMKVRISTELMAFAIVQWLAYTTLSPRMLAFSPSQIRNDVQKFLFNLTLYKI